MVKNPLKTSRIKIQIQNLEEDWQIVDTHVKICWVFFSFFFSQLQAQTDRVEAASDDVTSGFRTTFLCTGGSEYTP